MNMFCYPPISDRVCGSGQDSPSLVSYTVRNQKQTQPPPHPVGNTVHAIASPQDIPNTAKVLVGTMGASVDSSWTNAAIRRYKHKLEGMTVDELVAEVRAVKRVQRYRQDTGHSHGEGAGKGGKSSDRKEFRLKCSGTRVDIVRGLLCEAVKRLRVGVEGDANEGGARGGGGGVGGRAKGGGRRRRLGRGDAEDSSGVVVGTSKAERAVAPGVAMRGRSIRARSGGKNNVGDDSEDLDLDSDSDSDSIGSDNDSVREVISDSDEWSEEELEDLLDTDDAPEKSDEDGGVVGGRGRRGGGERADVNRLRLKRKRESRREDNEEDNEGEGDGGADLPQTQASIGRGYEGYEGGRGRAGSAQRHLKELEAEAEDEMMVDLSDCSEESAVESDKAVEKEAVEVRVCIEIT